MKKVIVKTGGDSIGVRFNTQERKIYGINVGDVMDISDMTLHKQADEDISNILAKQNQEAVMKEIKEKVKHD